jgi:hypothetical protein
VIILGCIPISTVIQIVWQLNVALCNKTNQLTDISPIYFKSVQKKLQLHGQKTVYLALEQFK